MKQVWALWLEAFDELHADPEESSMLRGVFVRGEGDLIEAFAPPYGPQAQIEAAFSGAAA